MAGNTNYSSIVSSRAQKEITTSWEWYEERLPGLGDKFIKAVIARIREIEESPGRYSAKHKSYKEVSVSSFPFLIIYRVNARKKSVRIVSVFHTAQSPKKKY